MSKAVEDLKKEHEAILFTLQILDKIVTLIGKREAVSKEDMSDLINFLKEFADKCHHGKEEGILFPAMVSAGVAEKGGPIGVMLSEHVMGRKLISNMATAISDNVDYDSFAKSAEEYTGLLKNHIQKENNVLFPMAEKVLSETKLEEIYAGFEEHEEKVIGKGRHEQLHAMLGKLNEKYLT